MLTSDDIKFFKKNKNLNKFNLWLGIILILVGLASIGGYFNQLMMSKIDKKINIAYEKKLNLLEEYKVKTELEIKMLSDIGGILSDVFEVIKIVPRLIFIMLGGLFLGYGVLHLGVYISNKQIFKIIDKYTG